MKNNSGGIYGGNGTVYETENFSNLKITSYGVHSSGANYGPGYFIVEYPDGSKAYYGNSDDSRSITDWSITNWQNPQDVLVNYAYSQANNVLNIVSIKYGSKAIGTQINEIKFNYKSRLREEEAYIAAQKITKKTILSEIKVLSNNVGFRNYTLLYDTTSLSYERLISITEKTGDNSKSYNPTVFEYENTTDDISVLPSSTNLTINPVPIIPDGYVVKYDPYESSEGINAVGDFDGNGKFGLITHTGGYKKNHYIFYPDIDSETTSSVGTKIYTGGIFDDLFLINNYLSGNASSGYKLSQNQKWCVVKTNYADDLTTLSIYSKNSSTANPANLESEISYNFPRYCLQSSPNLAYRTRKSYFTGDFNGDNISDCIVLERGINSESSYFEDGQTPFRNKLPQDILITSSNFNEDSGKVYFINFDKRVGVNAVSFSGKLTGTYNSSSTSKVFTADFNQDGKTDIIVETRGVFDVYSLNNDNIFVKIHTTSIPVDRNNYSPYLYGFSPGDYNGDGKVDYGPRLFSDGISFVPQDNFSFTPQGNPIDFNKDGKTDSLNILFDPNSTSVNDMVSFPSAPNNLPLSSPYMGLGSFTLPQISVCRLLIGKNLISKNQLGIYINTGLGVKKIHYVAINKDFSKEKMLKSVTLGNGVKEIITYSPLINGNEVYTASGSIENYPNQDLLNVPEIKVVSKIERQSMDVYKKRVYSYYGAVTNSNGLGFLGFRSTVKTNWHNDGTPIISYISKNDMTLRGTNVENYEVLGLHEPLETSENEIPRKIIKEGDYSVSGTDNLLASQSIVLKPNTWIKSGSLFSAKILDYTTSTSINAPDDYITRTLLTYEEEILNNKVFKIKNINSKKIDKLNNVLTDSETNYDNNNNVIKSTVILKEGNTAVQTSISENVYIDPTSSPYVVGRVSSKTQSLKVSGDIMKSEELYTYTNGLLTQVNKKNGDSDYVIEDNTYDEFGNITKKIIKGKDLSPRETSYEYDLSGRFLLKKIDIENLATSFSYNMDNGVLLSQTNSYGQTTSYNYDSWFKKVLTTDYLGKKQSYSYALMNKTIVVTSNGDDGSSVVEFFDDLGRKIKIGKKNLQGTFSYVNYLYDLNDRNYKISEAYYGSSPTQWNESKYDDYGRVTQNIEYTGKVTNVSYSDRTSTIDDGTKTKIINMNAAGNVISMTDSPGGTINYTYFANGNLKESDFGGVKTTITQDSWGRKTSIIDPSAGTYSYTYNSLGETTSETNSNGTTTYTLNSVGKPIEKTIVGTFTNSKTTYTYDSNSLLLKSKFEDLTNGTNTIINTYTYDDWKRVSTIKETTPYAEFIKDYSYDAFGRIETEKYTAKAGGKMSIKKIKNVYLNGSHYQILDYDNNSVLWQMNELNARGELKKAQTGPITITNTYDTYGFVSQFKYDKTSDSSNILTLNTAFDANKANLTSRTNNLFNWNESFEYDDLDRLTEFANVNGLQETQAYDDKGRILENSLGKYAYNTTKSYQNNSIELTPEALDYYSARGAAFSANMEDKTGWQGVFSKYDDTIAHGGKTSIKLTNTSQDEEYIQSDKFIEIDNSQATEYTYSVWVYGNSQNALIAIQGFTSNGIYSFGDNNYTSYPNQWTKIEKTFLVPADTKKLKIWLYNDGLGNIWFDDVQIRKTSDFIVPQRELNVNYNVFKSPVTIEETGVDKISFDYSDNNERSAMFYGGLNNHTDKLLRPNHKYYSNDGSMEIKQNINTGVFEFVTYIGGDGYSAPIVFKSDGGINQNYLYLQRDYQGSIVAIAGQDGKIVEKRLFDAWGNIIKVQDGAGKTLDELTVLDRGYTGHEHLQSINIIHMNGRLYDPKLHRFLQPDNNSKIC